MQLSQRQDAGKLLHEIQKKDDDIGRLTKERDEERTKLRSKDKEIERLQNLLKEQHLHAASTLERGHQDATKKVNFISTKMVL